MAIKHGLVWDGFHYVPIAKEDYFNYMKTGSPVHWEIESIPQEWEDELLETPVRASISKWELPNRDIVLDLFSGSGSTGVVAIREGADYIGIEINPIYAEISRQRIAKECGLTLSV